MDEYSWIISSLRSIADMFDTTAGYIDGVPLIGEYLASPFYFFGDEFDSIADFFLGVDDWWEWLKGEFEDLPSWDDLISALESKYGSLVETAAGMTDWLKEELESRYAILLESATVLDWITNAPAWFSEEFAKMKDTVVDWIVDSFESILDRIFAE